MWAKLQIVWCIKTSRIASIACYDDNDDEDDIASSISIQKEECRLLACMWCHDSGVKTLAAVYIVM